MGQTMTSYFQQFNLSIMLIFGRSLTTPSRLCFCIHFTLWSHYWHQWSLFHRKGTGTPHYFTEWNGRYKLHAEESKGLVC